jgi:hypothetical protein
MSKAQSPRKTGSAEPERKAPTAPASTARTPKKEATLIYGKKNFLYLLISIGLIALGMLLMLGGKQSSPDVWEPEKIYSTQRIVIAPFLIILGLVGVIFAIFARNETTTSAE